MTDLAISTIAGGQTDIVADMVKIRFIGGLRTDSPGGCGGRLC